MTKEKRSHIRRTIIQRARIESMDGALANECTLVDVSGGGARLVLATPDPLPSRFFLVLSHDGALRRLCQPVWQTETKAGVQFIFK
jgi:PilZ domain